MLSSKVGCSSSLPLDLSPHRLFQLQAEATGKLNLDSEMVRRLGLHGLSPAQCQLATTIWMSKPVVPTEAALLALHIPIIRASRKVLSINTAPPHIRSRRVTR